mgnify:CR=1 FL=1
MLVDGIELLVGSSLIFLVPIVVGLFERRVSADARHAIGLSAFVAACVAAIASRGPAIEVPSATLPVSLPSSSMLVVEPAGTATAPFEGWLIAYLAGVVLVLTRLVWRYTRGYGCVASLRATRVHDIEVAETATALGIKRSIDVVAQAIVASPFTWGIRNAVLAVPEDFGEWSPTARRNALVHELAHIGRRDHLTVLTARVIAALFWWHPLAWVCLKRLEEDAERACDDAVLRAIRASNGSNSMAPHVSYADDLVAIAKRDSFPGRNAPAGLALLTGTALGRRITAILASDQRRDVMSRNVKCIASLGLLVSGYLLGAAELSEESTSAYIPVFKATPVYPRDAQTKQISGYVLVEFDIGPNGATENVRVVDQDSSGLFADAAVRAAEGFHYLLLDDSDGLPERVEGVRNMIRFDYDEGTQQQITGAMQALVDARIEAESVLKEELGMAMAEAQAAGDGDRFAALSRVALGIDPGLAEYLVLRAGQLGTGDREALKLLTGTVLFQRGALDRARGIFAEVAERGPEAHRVTGSSWVAYIDREVERRARVHDAMVDLQR